MDFNILTRILQQFADIGVAAPSALISSAWQILVTLGVIQLAMTYIYQLIYEQDDMLEPLFKFIVKYGSFAFLVGAYSTIATTTFASFVTSGVIAGNNNIAAKDISNPSVIVQIGINKMKTIWDIHIKNNEGLPNLLFDIAVDTIFFNMKGMLQILGFEQKNALIAVVSLIFVTLAILICFFYIAIQLFVVQVEFLLVVGVGIILVPFGVWNQTSFIFDKIKSAIINIGIKVMFMTTFCSLFIAIITKIEIIDSMDISHIYYYMLSVLAFAYLSKKITSEVGALTQ